MRRNSRAPFPASAAAAPPRRGSAAAAAALTAAEDADGDDDEAPAPLRGRRALRARFGSAVERRLSWLRALAATAAAELAAARTGLPTKCRSVGQTTSSSISVQAAARTRQSRYGSMSRQSSSRSIANLVNGSPRRSSTSPTARRRER